VQVAANDRSLHAGFGGWATKRSGGEFHGLDLKTKPRESTWMGGLTARVAASKSFEAANMRHDRKACVEAKRACGSCPSVRWRFDEDYPNCP
jgi:hypothetical protein